MKTTIICKYLIILGLLFSMPSLGAGLKSGLGIWQPQQLYCELNVKSVGSQQLVEVSFMSERLAGKKKPKNIGVRYELVSTGGSMIEQRPIDLEEMEVERVNEAFYFSFVIDDLTVPSAILKIHISDEETGEKITKEARVEKRDQKVSFSLRNQGNPSQRDYITAGDEIVMVANQEKPIFLIRFDIDFMPAAPPTGNSIPAGPATMTVDSVLRITTNQPFTLQKEGLYFAQEDTTQTVGIGFRVVGVDYPKYSDVDKVAKSMIYISTDTEINGMLMSENKKAVLDNFWLNLGGDVNNAKRLIRTYYQRVAHSNEHFTTYKEGWKSDRGLLYIVFGPPADIAKTPKGERWVYYVGKKRRQVEFEFVKSFNIFSGNHYVLVRSPAYRRIWYDMVESWRKGEIQ